MTATKDNEGSNSDSESSGSSVDAAVDGTWE